MKDYLIGKNEKKQKKDFILDYVIEGNIVTIYYADGSVIKKSINEDKDIIISKLNTIMENQITELDKVGRGYDIRNYYYKKLENIITELILVSGFVGFAAIMGVFSLLSTYVFAAFAAIVGTVFSYQLIHCKNLRMKSDDYEKNSTFLKNKEYINDELQKESTEDINMNISKKSKQVLNENEYKLDIYNVDELELKQLKELLNYFENSKDLEETFEKTKVLKK